MLRKIKINSAGFTVLELLIAVGIFSIIALFAVGSLVVVFGANRKSNATQIVMTNLNFALENMSREIRFGDRYHCGTGGTISTPQNCTGGNTFISFRFDEDEEGSPQPPAQVSYRLTGSKIERCEGPVGAAPGASCWQDYISGDVAVTRFMFYVAGAGTGNTVQPRVTVVIAGNAGPQNEEGSTFRIQNTLSQRKEDI